MPRLVNLSNLKLHSPSSQIVGTPFANDNTRFEYPFPDIPPVEASASTSRTPPPLSSTLMLMTPKATTPIPANPKLKLKITPNPPIPPTLVAKKASSHMRKWSLAATGQRRSSSGQSNTSVSTTATDTSFSSNRSHPTPLSPSRKSRR
ncbi:hypothetical protein D9619_004626 [Psilocybe cf. subviscida]|uniref:Uncharacterized protein n=1 Tax=Psilocybe cf. subviscida TaxID=2480587 RepID=A0A8H5BQ07_9AGAR|nr:hypothetical protein D9619_004626 [Psilocybe cf. subviscida]